MGQVQDPVALRQLQRHLGPGSELLGLRSELLAGRYVIPPKSVISGDYMAVIISCLLYLCPSSVTL